MNKICPGVVIFIGERFYYFANMGNGGVTETKENKIVEENDSKNLSKGTDVTELPEEIIEEIDQFLLENNFDSESIKMIFCK